MWLLQQQDSLFKSSITAVHANYLLGLTFKANMAATSPSIPQLFTELDKFAKDGNYVKAQKIANKSKIKEIGIIYWFYFSFELTFSRLFSFNSVLQEKPDDKEAFHCKVICLIHQSCFREAVDVIRSASNKG